MVVGFWLVNSTSKCPSRPLSILRDENKKGGLGCLGNQNNNKQMDKHWISHFIIISVWFYLSSFFFIFTITSHYNLPAFSIFFQLILYKLSSSLTFHFKIFNLSISQQLRLPSVNLVLQFLFVIFRWKKNLLCQFCVFGPKDLGSSRLYVLCPV